MRQLTDHVAHVGKVVAAPLAIQPRFLAALEKTLNSPRALSRLARVTQDSRLSREAYQTVLLRDLSQLVLWASQRTLLACLSGGSHRRRSEPDRVLCLLPRDAPATHILRRAVPFAALGLPTRACFPESGARSRGAVAMQEVANALDLHDWMRMGALRAREEFKRHSRKSDIVVATGRRRTIAMLQTQTRARFFGAGGRCAILLGEDAKSLRLTYRRAVHANLPRSCSRIRAAFVVARNGTGPRLVSPWAERDSVGHAMRELNRLHPSAIYWIGNRSRTETLGRQLRRFTVFVTDTALKVGDAAGFGKDPVFGWPGDYRV